MGAGPLLVVLTGPSGAGKDSILSRMKELGRPYHFAVTATDRPRRNGERDGIDYYFLSTDEFQRMIDRGELLEHAIVYGQHKGLPSRPVRQALAAGQDVIFRTDVQGARYIKSLVPGAVTIFIAPPSHEEMRRRLRERDADSPEQMRIRVQTAEAEMAQAGEFDYTVVNDDLDRGVTEIDNIIERERAQPDQPPVNIP